MGKQEPPNDREMHFIIPPVPGYLSYACKELTQAVRIQQRTLERKLQSCLDELRQICLHEAELTGVLPKEFPLLPGETPPKVRRRDGALFKLDERTINYSGEDLVGCLERDLALQRQITEAARRLYLENSLSKQVRHQRKAALKAAERKLIALEDRLSLERSQENLHIEDSSSVSKSSSLSDVTSLEKDDSLCGVQAFTSVNGPIPAQTLEGLCNLRIENDNEKCPLQNSPWKESSLDLPYEKHQRRFTNSQGHNSIPAVTPIPNPQEIPTESDNRNSIGNINEQNIPENSNKMGVSHSMRVQSTQGNSEIRDRTLRRRATSFNSPSNPVYSLSFSSPVHTFSKPLCSSFSDSLSDSSILQPSYNLAYCPVAPKGEVLMVAHTPSIKEQNITCTPSKSEVTEELRCWHVRAQRKEADAPRPRSLDRKGAIRLHSGTSWSPVGRSHTQRAQKIQPRHVLRRTAEGAPLQWYDPEEAQIISQV
ncbi:innate immunity activator protein isoform X2 [Mixophyes fleayi]|uniref:innate immunity activator protein isoform X2 n=1 Tax=Mixophyes fleayi TaxID=3061075 RepID=UPI003F4E14DC